MSSQFSLTEIEGASEKFKGNKVLGSGGEGDVYLSNVYVNQKKTLVAVKQLRGNMDEIDKEIKTVSSFQHSNVVSLLGHCLESGNKILLYEYMQKGSLANYIKNSTRNSQPWLQSLNICLGAACGLQYLHSPTNQHGKGIIHRDVKPDNILLSEDWVAKVSDFGLVKLSDANQTKSTMITERKGTRGYFAPEYNLHGTVTREIDVYAFGVVLFEILCRQQPWELQHSINIFDDHDYADLAKKNVDPDIVKEISTDSLNVFANIIDKSLKVDPKKRPSMDLVVSHLEIARTYQKHYESDDNYQGTGPKASSFSSRRENLTTGGGDKYDDTIVIDIGGAITKIGYAKDESPRAVFATLVGYGRKTNGPDYENTLHHALHQTLNYLPEKKHPVLLTESPLEFDATESRRKEYMTNREKMTEVIFGKFQVPAMYIAMQPVLSLFSRGQTTGVVVESGENVSKSVPIYEGHVVPQAITSLNMAGRDLTNHLKKILTEDRRYSMDYQALDEIVRDVKEKLAYVALDSNLELMVSSRTLKNNYTLPDGKLIAVGTERFQCPEALFHPSMVGMRVPGIHEITYNSITKCDADIRDELYGNIVLAGGTTMLPGIGDRMEEEIRVMAPRTKVIKVSAPTSMYSAWVGGAKFASLSTFHQGSCAVNPCCVSYAFKSYDRPSMEATKKYFHTVGLKVAVSLGGHLDSKETEIPIANVVKENPTEQRVSWVPKTKRVTVCQ